MFGIFVAFMKIQLVWCQQNHLLFQDHQKAKSNRVHLFVHMTFTGGINLGRELLVMKEHLVHQPPKRFQRQQATRQRRKRQVDSPLRLPLATS